MAKVPIDKRSPGLRWYYEHREQVRLQRQTNSENNKNYQREYRKNNAEILSEKETERYQHKQESKRLREEIFFKKILEDKKCERCGTTVDLCFHHIDPKEKKFTIRTNFAIKNIPIILEELKKCIILCHHCHPALHFELKKQRVRKC